MKPPVSKMHEGMETSHHPELSKEDLSAIGKLPARAGEKLLFWYYLLAPLLPPPGEKSVSGIQQSLDKVAVKAGASAVTTRRLYDRLRRDGWRGLVDRSLAGPEWQKEGKPRTAPESKQPPTTKAQMLIRTLDDFERRGIERHGFAKLSAPGLRAMSVKLSALSAAVAEALQGRRQVRGKKRTRQRLFKKKLNP